MRNTKYIAPTERQKLRNRYVRFVSVSARSQAPAWERDCSKSFALSQKDEIPPGEKKQELLVQARSQAGAWERERLP